MQAPPPPEQSISVQPPGTRGQKAAGMLSHIECSPRGLTFLVRSENRTLRFFAAQPDKIFIYSKEMEDIGPIKIKCGPYTPAASVVVTFKVGAGDCQCDGEPLSIVFADKSP